MTCLDSSNKCNKMVVKDLVRSFETKNLTRTVIKTVVNEVLIAVGEQRKQFFLGKYWRTRPLVFSFGTPLPGRIRVGKEEVGI